MLGVGCEDFVKKERRTPIRSPPNIPFAPITNIRFILLSSFHEFSVTRFIWFIGFIEFIGLTQVTQWSPTGKPVVPQNHTHLRQGFCGSSADERNPPKHDRLIAENGISRINAFLHGQGRGLLRRRMNSNSTCNLIT